MTEPLDLEPYKSLADFHYANGELATAYDLRALIAEVERLRVLVHECEGMHSGSGFL